MVQSLSAFFFSHLPKPLLMQVCYMSPHCWNAETVVMLIGYWFQLQLAVMVVVVL